MGGLAHGGERGQEGRCPDASGGGFGDEEDDQQRIGAGRRAGEVEWMMPEDEYAGLAGLAIEFQLALAPVGEGEELLFGIGGPRQPVSLERITGIADGPLEALDRTIEVEEQVCMDWIGDGGEEEFELGSRG